MASQSKLNKFLNSLAFYKKVTRYLKARKTLKQRRLLAKLQSFKGNPNRPKFRVSKSLSNIQKK